MIDIKINMVQRRMFSLLVEFISLFFFKLKKNNNNNKKYWPGRTLANIWEKNEYLGYSKEKQTEFCTCKTDKLISRSGVTCLCHTQGNKTHHTEAFMTS